MLGVLVAAAAAVTGLGDRPAALTGPGGDPAYAAWLHGRVLELDDAFFDACPEATIQSVRGAPLARGDAAYPSTYKAAPGALWLERVRLSGCGRTTVHNVQVMRRRDGWESIGLVPGEILSSPAAQTAAMQAVATVSMNTPPRLPCQGDAAIRSLVTEAATVTAPPDASGRWSEFWPVRVCGLPRPVTVTFTPSTAGPAVASVAPAW